MACSRALAVVALVLLAAAAVADARDLKAAQIDVVIRNCRSYGKRVLWA